MLSYDAFISYSHAKDKPIAAALQSIIQKLGKAWYRRRALRLFRDDTSLSATPQLWPTIEKALSESRFLILLASPDAAGSPWVNKEVSWWLDHKSADSLLIGVTDGDLRWDHTAGNFSGENVPLPPAAIGRLSEPKWVDLRAYRNRADPRDAPFIDRAADFAATVRGVPKDDLLSQEVKQQRRALMLAWGAVASLLCFLVLAGWQWRVAVRNENAALDAKQRLLAEFNNQGIILSATLKTGLSNANVRRIFQLTMEAIGSAIQQLRRTDPKAALSLARAMANALNDTRGGAPQDQDILEALAQRYQEIGELLAAAKERDGASRAYKDAIGVRRKMLEDDPDNAQWKLALVSALLGLADVGANPETNLTEALEILQKLQSAGMLAQNKVPLIAQIQTALARLADGSQVRR